MPKSNQEAPMFLVLSICLLAPITWALGDGSVRFINQPRDQIARAGETITVFCAVNQGDGRFMWVRDDQVISQGYTITLAQEPHRFSIQGINGEYNLRIIDGKAEDSGSYRCMVTSGGSGIMSTLGRLVVETPPAQEYPTCKSSETNDVAVGESVTVSCTVEGGNPAADLSILKNDKLVQGDSIFDGVSYTWTVVEADEGATFSCVGKHVFWTDNRTCRLGPYRVITSPPTTLLVPRVIKIIAGGSAAFVCSATSAPRAHYRWFLEDIEVFHGSENNRFTVEHIDTASILQIHGVFVYDSGRVLCYVEAATGTIFAVANLEVLPDDDVQSTGPPVIVPHTTDITTTVDTKPNPVSPNNSQQNLVVIIGSVAACVIIILVVIIIIVVLVGKSRQDRRSAAKLPAHQQVDPQDDDVLYKSPYVTVVRSWLFPVHKNTQTSVTAFGVDNPSGTAIGLAVMNSE